MDMRKLLEAITKFAGEPEQKPGDQVRGTDKPPKGKDHPFKGRLVGAAESKGASLKDLSEAAEENSLVWELAEEFSNFTEAEEKIGTHKKRDARKGVRNRKKEEGILEAMVPTRDIEWKGWIIRYQTKPQIEGQPLRWMVWHKKRGTEDSFEGSAATPEEAVEAAKEWILSGGNAKEIKPNSNMVINFNAKFVSDILNGGRGFFAKIVPGPTLVISDDRGPGFKPTYLGRTKDKAGSNALPLPVMAMSGKEAIAAGLKAHGRYILGDTSKDAAGDLSFPLIYQTTVNSPSDKMRLPPGITVSMERDETSESIMNESMGDGDVANAVVAEVIALIGEGHTEVSPDVITTKVSAALGRPFMLKDLVAANNASPELQHYISSINPSKIKFSTDILTVKNEDPVKAKEQAQSGVANMAARAAGRDRSLGENKLFLVKFFDAAKEIMREGRFEGPSQRAVEEYCFKKGYDVASIKEGKENIDIGAVHQAYEQLLSQYPDVVKYKLATIVTNTAGYAHDVRHNTYAIAVETTRNPHIPAELKLQLKEIQEKAYAIAKGFEKGNAFHGGLQAFSNIGAGQHSAYDSRYTGLIGAQDWDDMNEGWESGPDEGGRSMRDLGSDPDWAYDQRRQEKADAATRAANEKRPQEKVYTLVGRGPNMEPNYEFPGEYASTEEAVAARDKLMADPSTPNPRMIGISVHTRYLDKDLTEAPIEMDPENPMDPMIYGAEANPAKLSYRMSRAQRQLADLADQAKNATPYQWQQIAMKFNELTMNINQIKHALEELAKVRRKGGVRSRGIDVNIDEAESAIGGGATGKSVNDPQQIAKVAQATTALKSATGSTAPAPKLAQAIDKASQGQQVNAQDMQALDPVMDVIKKTAEDPKLANQFKSLAQQARRSM